MPNLLFTEEGLFAGSNYEIGAYVDFLVGINAAEVLGHSRSSFGRTLNNWKNTSNHYDLLFG